jgi:RNA polymerase sigma-70 factor (ECF subfamily)
VRNDRTADLYVEHRRKLVNYAYGIVGDNGRAEDIVQEAYMNFRAATSSRLLDEPVAYLYRVVRNLALDRRRRASLEDRHIVGDFARLSDMVAEDLPSPEAQTIARQELERVIDAMGELPERTRVALEMHRFAGCTLKEIAKHLKISTSMAQVLVTDGVRHCQRRL